jgi:putative flippase GtrA
MRRLLDNSLLRFLAVGGAMGLATVAARELLGGWFFPAGGAGYAASVLVVYLLAILCSFALHRVFTFGSRRRSADGHLLRYALVSLASAVLTSLLATYLCFETPLSRWLGDWTPAVSFAVAALTVALLAYVANAHWAFRPAVPNRGQNRG